MIPARATGTAVAAAAPEGIGLTDEDEDLETDTVPTDELGELLELLLLLLVGAGLLVELDEPDLVLELEVGLALVVKPARREE